MPLKPQNPPPPFLSDAMLASTSTPLVSTPLLRVLYCLDVAMHEAPGGKVAEELRMARDAALGALCDDERRIYSGRAPIETVRSAHEASMHALALRPTEVYAMLGLDKSAMKRLEASGLLAAWKTPHMGPVALRPWDRRYRASDVIAFCTTHGIPTPPALLPGATVCDLPPSGFRADKGTYAAKVKGRKGWRRCAKYAALENEMDEPL